VVAPASLSDALRFSVLILSDNLSNRKYKPLQAHKIYRKVSSWHLIVLHKQCRLAEHAGTEELVPQVKRGYV
jgi:hypothetical protein